MMKPISNTLKIKRIVGICFFLIPLAAIIVMYLCAHLEGKFVFSLIVFCVTSYFALSQYWIQNDLIFKELFTEFNSRFDKLNDSLNEILANDNHDHKANVSDENKIIQDYLNLCSEEYLWYKKGRINSEIWERWKIGINFYLENEKIKNFFKDQEVYNDSYYNIFDDLKIK